MRIQLCHKHSRTGRSREVGRIIGRSGSIRVSLVSLNFVNFIKKLAGGVKGLLDDLHLEEVVVGVNPHPLLQHLEEQGISISVRVITEKLENE